jgi:hypothetical protein
MGPLPMSYGGRRSFISSGCCGILQQEQMSHCGNSRQLSWLERDRQVGRIMGKLSLGWIRSRIAGGR